MALFRSYKLILLSVFLFAGLAFLVTAGLTQNLDESGVFFLRGSSEVGDLMPTFIANVTHLGDSATLAVLSLLTVGVLVWRKKHVEATWFLLAASGSFVITAISKWAFGRDRPEVVEQFVSASSASFPSGHTLRSAVIYVLLAVIIARSDLIKNNMIIYGIAALVIIVNGLSRIYLGVHWPTDIIGAWLIASFWLLLCKNGYDRSVSRQTATDV